MRTVKFATLVIAASATLFACKPKEEATAPVAEVTGEEAAADEATAAASADRREACNLTMSAPEAAEWTTYWESTGGANGAKSIHWGSDAEKEAQAKAFTATALEISCSSGESPSITVVLTANASTESDVPMDAGSYPIWGRQQASTVQGGQFLTSTLSFNGRAFDSRSGTISISEFTSRGVSGTFTLEGAEIGTEEGAPIQIQGSFELPCRAGMTQSACTAN